MLQRAARERPKLTPGDRLLWVWRSRIWSGWRSALAIVKPETVIAWHRVGFRLFWTWKVRRGRPGRPLVSREVRDLIRRMCRENPSWGAPRIHGELLKLGIDIGETSVSKYMVRCQQPPSQTWRTFLQNHLQQLVSIDFFTAPTIGFQVLYVFLVLAHDRRRMCFGAVMSFLACSYIRQRFSRSHPEKFLAIWQKKVESQSSNPLLFLGRHTEFIIRRCFFPYSLLFFAIVNLTNVAFVTTALGANLVWVIALYSCVAPSTRKRSGASAETGTALSQQATT